MCKCKYNVIYCQQATLYVSYTNIALKYANMQNYAKVCQFFTKTAAMHIKKYDRSGQGMLLILHRDKCCVVLLFYVHGKHLRSCRGGQLT